MVSEGRMSSFEPLLVPTGVALWSKEVRTHVVISPMDLPAKLAEVINDFGADEAG